MFRGRGGMNPVAATFSKPRQSACLLSALVLAAMSGTPGCAKANSSAAEAGDRAIGSDAARPTRPMSRGASPKGVPSGHTPLKNYLVGNPPSPQPRATNSADASSDRSSPATAAVLPPLGRDPDWELDPADSAKDYVSRYMRGTKRYGAQTGCVTVGTSTFVNDRSVVETHNDASGTCGAAGALRDRFFVRVAADRMTIDDSLHQPKLQPWPDGSDPNAPPAKVADAPHMGAWKAPLSEALKKLELATVRLQLYGRGTYPVLSIAGWHGRVQRGMTTSELEAPAKELCTSNDNDPMAIFAGLDRSTVLRITCPGTARWDAL